jgi:hypothetical protein
MFSGEVFCLANLCQNKGGDLVSYAENQYKGGGVANASLRRRNLRNLKSLLEGVILMKTHYSLYSQEE